LDCENEYCIYGSNNQCYLDKVAINSLGMCEDCIMVSLDKDFLETEKKRQRNEINKRRQ